MLQPYYKMGKVLNFSKNIYLVHKMRLTTQVSCNVNIKTKLKIKDKDLTFLFKFKNNDFQ